MELGFKSRVVLNVITVHIPAALFEELHRFMWIYSSQTWTLLLSPLCFCGQCVRKVPEGPDGC